MYDDYNRKCPNHPTLPQPCQVCAAPKNEVPHPESAPSTTLVGGVDWQAQADVPYNTIRPRPLTVFNPSQRLMEKLGPVESGERSVPPPPPRPPRAL